MKEKLGTNKKIIAGLKEKVKKTSSKNGEEKLLPEEMSAPEEAGIEKNVLEIERELDKEINGPLSEEKEKPASEEVGVEKEIGNLSPEDREKIGWGLSTIGFKVEKAKNDFFAYTFNKSLSKIEKKGTAGRFLAELRDSFVRDSGIAAKKAEDIKSGKEKHRLSNAGLLVGNILKYGRVVADFTGASIANPFRYVMMGGMITARFGEAGKEARLKNEEVIEKTRIQDADLAAEEAWKIYQKAQQKESKGDVSVEALKNAYMMEMPKDLLERLKNPSTANSFIQKNLRKRLEIDIKHINDSLEKIYSNSKLSLPEKEEQEKKLILKQKGNLEDYDRMLTQYGTVDELAMAGRYAQTVGKGIVLGMQIETALVSAEKLFETVSNIYHNFHSVEKVFTFPVSDPKAFLNPLPKPESGPAIPNEPLMEPMPADSLDAIVHKGQGVEHAFIRQIENNPELAQELGFKGDLNDKVALHKFAGTEAHKIAIKMGYVGENGKEVRITEADKVAFELKVENGQPVVVEKTIDGKIIETYDSKEGYEFGKTPENQYEKVSEATYREAVHQNIEKNNTEMLEKKVELEKQAMEHMERETEKMETEAKLKQEIETHIDAETEKEKTNITDTSAEKPKPNPQHQAVGIGTAFETGGKVGIGEKIHTGETIFTGSDTPIGGYYGSRPTTLTFGGERYFLDPFSHQYRSAFGKQFFPELSPSDNLILQNNPEFAENPYDLPEKELVQIYKAHDGNMNFLFENQVTASKLESLGEIKAEKLLEYTDGDPTIKRMSDYLNLLKNFAGPEPELKPKTGFLGIGAETSKEYIIRALQKITDDGKLEVFQESLRK